MSAGQSTSIESPGGPPSSLRATLLADGIIATPGIWTPFGGGKTNHLWRVTDGSRDLVCKIYASDGDSPLFPNDPAAEVLALTALAGQQIAPEFVAVKHGSWGVCLIYRHVEGRAGGASAADVARALGKLHRFPPPAGLRALPGGSVALVRQGRSLLAGAGDTGALPPVPRMQAVAPTANPVFLHGDPVPQNIIETGVGAVLIDWQCPAVGDACEDLSIYLSPAMQLLYRGARMTSAEEAAFLSAYPDNEVCHRYLRLRPLYHWRMAAHCLWKARNGAPAYGAGLQAELEALQQCEKPDRRKRQSRAK